MRVGTVVARILHVLDTVLWRILFQPQVHVHGRPWQLTLSAELIICFQRAAVSYSLTDPADWSAPKDLATRTKPYTKNLSIDMDLIHRTRAPS